jgi:hypothetical protein
MRDGVDSWTTDHWDTVNYYVSNKAGLGIGHKLFGIPKPEHRELFGEFEPEADIMSIEGRFAVIELTPAVLPGTILVKERTDKYEFIFERKLTQLNPAHQWWSEASYLKLIEAKGNAADRDYGWLKPFLPINIAEIEPLLKKFAWGPTCLDSLSADIRKLIRKTRKANQPCADLLLSLYGARLAKSLVDLLTFEDQTANMLAPYFDNMQLEKLQLSYAHAGYRDIKTLNGVDIKWLLKEFGEPPSHCSAETLFLDDCLNAVTRYCWSQAGVMLGEKVTASQEASIRAWLTHRVTETMLTEASLEKWRNQSAAAVA